MTYLIVQMLTYLLIAAAMGVAIGWFARAWWLNEGSPKKGNGLSADTKAQLLGLQETLQAAKTEWESKLHAAESKANHARSELDQLKTAAAGFEHALNAKLADADSLHIAKIASLQTAWRAKLARAEADSEDRLRALQAIEKQTGGDLAAQLPLQLLALRSELDAAKVELERRTVQASPNPNTAPQPSSAKIAIAPDEPDDLKQIAGIGPVLEMQLYAVGIETFRDIAALTPHGVEELTEKLEHVFGDRITRERWVAQAAQLHRKKYGVEP
jgi:predicted flap endonuclease-1-like 5' DNA nuclease